MQDAAITPGFQPALSSVERLLGQGKGLSQENVETLKEIARRLRNLEHQARRLIEINNELILFKTSKATFDSTTETVSFQLPGTEASIQVPLKRADPNVPITMNILATGGAYVAGSDKETSDADLLRRLEYESLLEGYYYLAHRIVKLVKKLPGLSSTDCPPIRVVRNKLLEHPESIQPYSFGYGTAGPVVRPARVGKRLWEDAGLVPNTEALVKTLCSAFKRLGG